MVLAARRGDDTALEALYARFAPTVHGCLLSYVGHVDAEDLVQDVFETVLGRLGDLRDPAAFPGWLMATVRNTAKQHLRRAGQFTDVMPDLESMECGPEDSTEARQLIASLSKLPARFREVLILRLVEGLTGPEIAEHTGLSHGTVRVYLHHGIHLLRTAIAEPPFRGSAS